MDTTQRPSLSAISSFVKPSSFQTAMVRSCSSGFFSLSSTAAELKDQRLIDLEDESPATQTNQHRPTFVDSGRDQAIPSSRYGPLRRNSSAPEPLTGGPSTSSVPSRPMRPFSQPLGERFLTAPAFLLPQIEATAKKTHAERDEVALRLAGLARQEEDIDIEGKIAAATAALQQLEQVLAESAPLAVRTLLREHIERIEVHF